MNPRQRRGLVLLVLAGLGMVAVFVLVAGYVADVRSQVEPKVQVLMLREPARANEPFQDRQVRAVEIPARWAPDNALSSSGALTGLVAGTDLPAGTMLQQGMAVDSPTLQQGEREIAISVDAETGVAGKVEPRSIVDVIATFGPGEGAAGRSTVLVPEARVLEVGQVTEQPGQTPQANPSQVVPITFALTLEESLRLTFAESFATEVRLALRRPGDVGAPPVDERTYTGGESGEEAAEEALEEDEEG